MKIKMTMQPTGLLNGEPWPEVGEEIEVHDVVAVDLLNAGMADAVEAAPKTEHATAKPKATTRNRRKKTAPEQQAAPAPDAGEQSSAEDDKTDAKPDDDAKG